MISVQCYHKDGEVDTSEEAKQAVKNDIILQYEALNSRIDQASLGMQWSASLLARTAMDVVSSSIIPILVMSIVICVARRHKS